jgi:Zn-dependent peptidase ImmA (M78 family)/transcriptional regulator with XRE-family HTH domain
MSRVTVKPEILRWARERVDRSAESLRVRFPKYELWERGEAAPTLKQLEAFAKATYVPIGYLFLPQPPEERIPIPDLRTVASRGLEQPSPNLLDTIYLCQQRQVWYRDYARAMGERSQGFVGSVRRDAPIEQVAERMHRALEFDLEARRECGTWTEALRLFIEQADDLGVLVMCSGVVGSNNKRTLDTEEFRGFALVDDYAPLVFINGADTKAGQMFTLAHELAHVWLGESALSDVTPASTPTQQIEVWCNRVAAEFLVPLEVLKQELPRQEPLADLPRLARRFKVSTLVILRRILDAERIDRATFQHAYDVELTRLLSHAKSRGGDFYLTLGARASKRFARALVVSTLEGQSSFTEAFRLLGLRKMETFRDLGQSLGVHV